MLGVLLRWALQGSVVVQLCERGCDNVQQEVQQEVTTVLQKVTTVLQEVSTILQ